MREYIGPLTTAGRRLRAARNEDELSFKVLHLVQAGEWIARAESGPLAGPDTAHHRRRVAMMRDLVRREIVALDARYQERP